MTRSEKIRWIRFVLIILIYLVAGLLLTVTSQAKSTGEKVVICDDANPRTVKITSGKVTVLSFPMNPKDIVPGNARFDFKRIRNDLNILALSPSAKTNIIVYMAEKRCAFNLVTVLSGGDEILFVKDSKDKQFEVKFHE